MKKKRPVSKLMSKLFVLKQTFYGHTHLITCLVRLFENEEMEEIAWSSRDGDIRIWSPLDQKNDLFELKQTLVGHKHYVICLASKGFYLASGSLKEILSWYLFLPYLFFIIVFWPKIPQ